MSIDRTWQRKSVLQLPLREVLQHDEESEFGRMIHLYWKSPSADEITRPVWIDFEIFEAIGRESPGALICTRPGSEGRPLYYATDARDMCAKDGLTADLSRATWAVRGFVKFDGCTQVYFPRGPLHYDDKASLRGLFGSICRAQERCYEVMDDAGAP